MNIHGKETPQPMSEIRDFISQAMAMSQRARRELSESKDITHPANYVIQPDRHALVTQPIEMVEARRQDIELGIKHLVLALYGVKEMHTQWQVDTPQTVGGGVYNRSYNLAAIARNQGKSMFSLSGSNHNAPISIDYCARLLWWKSHPELEDATVTMSQNNESAKVYLTERETRWVDEQGELHREGAAAIIDPSGRERNRYYWHGDHVGEDLFLKPYAANLHYVLKDPGFSIIGGFAGLAKHNEFDCIATHGTCQLFEGGGNKTYYYEGYLRSLATYQASHPNGPPHAPYKGRKFHNKPSRFLLDSATHGMSGWVSKGVKTIAGAQRSLLRIKLTQGRRAR